MDAVERARIANVLATADDATLKEIIREAESFLADQLKAGLAADSRAMTFAGIMAAITSFLIGSSASLIAAKAPVWPFIAPVGVIIGCLVVALFYAIRAASPTSFEYCGNDPQSWVDEVSSNVSLSQALAGQAALYSRDIKKNAKVLDANHASFRAALNWVRGGILGAAGLEFVLVMVQLGRSGFL